MSQNICSDFFVERSRKLRRELTPIERILWYKINRQQLGVKFRRQYPFLNKYILDFVCLEKRLVIELDGNEHTFTDKDVMRDKFLNECGFGVLRFWNNQIVNDLDICVEKILRVLSERD